MTFRLLALSYAVSDRAHGGEAIASFELIRHLALEGVSVDVVSPLVDVERAFPENVRVHAVKGGPLLGNTGANKAAMLTAARRLHRESRFDATHIVSQFTSFPVEWRPFVISGCWVFPPEETGGRPERPLATLARKLGTGSLASRVDAVRDVAFALREERLRGWDRARTLREADLVVVRQGLGLKPLEREARRVAHVPFGIDPSLFPFSAAEREPIVLYAGILKAYKNVDGLLRAFRDVLLEAPAARLRIAGDGPERAPLEALARSLDLGASVEFLGHVPRYALADELQRAALLVLPSHGESFGQVCLEAMACGTPVAVTDRSSGAHDFLEDGVNGRFLRPREPASIAGAILDLLARGRTMATAARATAERFSWREVARRHVALYRSL